MNSLLITILAVNFIILSGCTSQKGRLIKQGYPLSYAEGYNHGCREGTYQSNNKYNQRRAETIKSEQEALIVKILNKDNEPVNLKATANEHQQSQTKYMALDRAFKTVENEDISVDPTSTNLLLNSLSVGSQTTSIDKSSRLKMLTTVTDYMHNNTDKNTNWSETDFQYKKGWSDAFFECKGIATAKAAASKRSSQITNFGVYGKYEIYNNYSDPYNYDWIKEEQRMRKYEKKKKAMQQQREFQAQQNQLFQRSLEQPKPRFEQGQPAIPHPLIDNNQLLQQQIEWQQQNSVLQRMIEQSKPRFEQGRPAIARPLIDNNQLFRQHQYPRIQRTPKQPVTQRLPNNFTRLLQQPRVRQQQPGFQIRPNINLPPQNIFNQHNQFQLNNNK